MAISAKLRLRIDEWLKSERRNEYGDPVGTVYTGGNPLFDERSPQLRDRYEYILSKHPELRREE